MNSTVHSLLPKCENEGKKLQKEVINANSQYFLPNIIKREDLFKSSATATDGKEEFIFQPCDQQFFNKTAFQIRRQHKQPAIEKYEMKELEEKLKKTENNIIRLQNLISNDESLGKLISKELNTCKQGSSDIVTEKIEHIDCHKSSEIIPVLTLNKNHKVCSKMTNKTLTNKIKHSDENQCDPLSILMDYDPKTTNRKKRSKSGGGASLRPRAPELEPNASDSSPTRERTPTRSYSYGILPAPSWTPPAVTPQGSQEDLGLVLGESNICSPSKGDLQLISEESVDLSEAEARPTLGVLRFPKTTSESIVYSTGADGDHEGKRDSKKEKKYVEYVEILRGVMIQDKRASQILKSCVKDMKVLQEKLESIDAEISDDYSSALREQLIQGRNNVGCGLGSNLNQDVIWKVRSHRGEQLERNAKVNTKSKTDTNTSKTTRDTLVSLEKTKKHILKMYGKSGISTSNRRKLEEHTRWK